MAPSSQPWLWCCSCTDSWIFANRVGPGKKTNCKCGAKWTLPKGGKYGGGGGKKPKGGNGGGGGAAADKPKREPNDEDPAVKLTPSQFDKIAAALGDDTDAVAALGHLKDNFVAAKDAPKPKGTIQLVFTAANTVKKAEAKCLSAAKRVEKAESELKEAQEKLTESAVELVRAQGELDSTMSGKQNVIQAITILDADVEELFPDAQELDPEVKRKNGMARAKASQIIANTQRAKDTMEAGLQAFRELIAPPTVAGVAGTPMEGVTVVGAGDVADALAAQAPATSSAVGDTAPAAAEPEQKTYAQALVGKALEKAKSAAAAAIVTRQAAPARG